MKGRCGLAKRSQGLQSAIFAAKNGLKSSTTFQNASILPAMRTIYSILMFLTSAALCVAAPVIAIQPLGPVSAERLAMVKKGLETAYGVEAEILETKPLPKEAWYEPRSRYRAEKLLTFLEDKTPEKYQIVIGLTAKDISTTKEEHEDWGIFGLGELDGRVCVVSTFRLGARGADEAKLRDRLRNVAVHEVGHVMALEHCPINGCVMQDAESSIETVDRESGEFCDECKVKWPRWLNRRTD
jgi:archaemetzincin